VAPPSSLTNCLCHQGCVFSLGLSTVGVVGTEATSCCRAQETSTLASLKRALPPPTLNGPCPPQDEVDESLVWPVPDHSKGLPTPQDTSAPPQPLATPHTAQSPATPGSLLEAAPQPRITIRLPGRRMNRPDTHPTRARGELNDANESIEYVEDDDSSTDGGADTPTRPRHVV
jgi:hypothetical protein